MANLFFIHTPLQIMVAQQIIKSENLTDNILIYGCESHNMHYLEIYEVILFNDYWTKKIYMDTLTDWASFPRKRLLSSFRRCLRGYKFIDNVVASNNVDTLYIGDMNSSCSKFASFVFKRKGKEIVFFEEGVGHYVFTPKNRSKKTLPFDYIIGLLSDIFFFYPFFGFRYGAFCFWKELTFDKLPMDIRYSIRPFYSEKFDRLIHVSNIFSEKLLAIINSDIEEELPNDSILFVNAPAYLWAGNNNKSKDVFYKLIEEYFLSIERHTVICIKFHPSDGLEEKKGIIDIIEKIGLKYRILAKDINIPVEYYLQFIKFKNAVGFYSATFNYNGLLYPKTLYTSLLYAYYIKCKQDGIKSLYVMESLLESEDILMKQDYFVKRYNP